MDTASSTEDTSERSDSVRSLLVSDAHNASETSALLSLPPEIRNLIYELAVVDRKHTFSLPKMPSFLGVNKQLRKEAGYMFFALNTFAIPVFCGRITSSTHVTAPTNTLKWLVMVDISLFFKIRSLLFCRYAIPGHSFECSYAHGIDFGEKSNRVNLKSFDKVGMFPKPELRSDGERVYKVCPRTRSNLNGFNAINRRTGYTLTPERLGRMLDGIRLPCPQEIEWEWECGQLRHTMLLVNFD